MSQAHAAERVPRAAARRSASSSSEVIDALRAPSSCTASPLETRAVEPLDQLLRKGGDLDKEVYVLRRLQADGRRPTTPASACTST